MRWPQWALQVMIILVITVLLFIGYGFWQIKVAYFIRPIRQVHLLITLPKAASAKSLSEILVKKNVISTPSIFLFLLKYYHVSHLLKSGTYMIERDDTVWSLLEKIVKGRVYTVQLRIVEGTRWCDNLQSFLKNEAFDFQKSMLSSLKTVFPSLEGAFYPSTYRQPYGESILPVLQLSHDTLQKRLQEIWSSRDMDLPYQTPYELLIAASIIEKESAIESERHLISGVIVNRLRMKMPLQMDPTVSYGLSACTHLQLKGSDTKIDTPYNTYLHTGLPPTPIAMVSDSSLIAAAHPMRTAYLYFVANGRGQHVFSTHYQQQKQAVQQLRNLHAN